MRENREYTSVKDVIQKNEELQAQVNFLQTKYDKLLHSHRDYRDENSFLKRQNQALKFRCSDYSKKISDLESEIADMKFTRDYLTSEDAGKAFARELLGKPMTESDIAEEEFISNGEALYEATWNINGGDDF